MEELKYFVYLDNLKHGPDGGHGEEDVGGEVLVRVLHHQVARQRALVLDPHAGDQAQVVADLREHRLAFS